MRASYRIRGFGLTEILISLFLSTLIMTLLIQSYVSNKRQYSELERSLETEMEVQWVQEFLRDRIHQAGFTPCIGIDYLVVRDHRKPGERPRSIHLPDMSDPGIQVNRMSQDFVEVAQTVSLVEIHVSQKRHWALGHPVLVADCHHAEINEIDHVETGANGELIVLKYPLYESYQSAFLGEWMEERWFIDFNSKGENALYYQSASHKEELSQLIVSLQARSKRAEKTLVEISLGFNEGDSTTFTVGVRSA